MDNPNARGPVNIRRHKSLPDPRRRTSQLFSSNHHHNDHHRHANISKSNPYVGWFRHSPPTCIKHISAASFLRKRTSVAKNSPYVGWFRHAPPMSRHSSKIFCKTDSLLGQELVHLFSSTTKAAAPQDQDVVLSLTDWLSGSLLGGGVVENENSDHHSSYAQQEQNHQAVQSICSKLSEHSEASPSATVKVLSRLACWFLLPFHECENDAFLDNNKQTKKLPSSGSSDSSSSSCCSDLSTCYDDDDEEEDSHDCYDTIVGSGVVMTSSASIPEEIVSTVISSQAAAYYAHQSSSSGDGHHHHHHHLLDYDTITQMDIVRMTRNASRHLDVESITQLPTVTYQAPPKKKKAQQEQEKQQESNKATSPSGPPSSSTEEGMSWMLIHGSVDQDVEEEKSVFSSQRSQQQSEDQEQHRLQDVCVICLEQFQTGDRLRVLPCHHSFHIGCIDRWLSGSASFEACFTSGCPTCKKRPAEQERTTSDQSERSDGSVPSWAFARIGDALAARDSGHF